MWNAKTQVQEVGYAILNIAQLYIDGKTNQPDAKLKI